MTFVGADSFVNEQGQPLSGRIQHVLRVICPRLRQRLQSLGDEVVVSEILEEAGSRIADLERASGPVRNLNAYAWTTVLNVARSRMRRSSMRLIQSTMAADDAPASLGGMQAQFGTVKQIESHILVEQLMAQLTAEERLICTWKQLGFSSREIAAERGSSVASIDTLFHRIKRKVRAALEAPSSTGAGAPARRDRRTA